MLLMRIHKHLCILRNNRQLHEFCQHQLEIDIKELTKILCGITSEDIKNAKEILAPYKKAYDRDKEIKAAFKINRRKLFDAKRAKK